jgi:hypothetical protein
MGVAAEIKKLRISANAKKKVYYLLFSSWQLPVADGTF